MMAQGGIQAADKPEDSPEKHYMWQKQTDG